MLNMTWIPQVNEYTGNARFFTLCLLKQKTENIVAVFFFSYTPATISVGIYKATKMVNSVIHSLHTEHHWFFNTFNVMIYPPPLPKTLNKSNLWISENLSTWSGVSKVTAEGFSLSCNAQHNNWNNACCAK